MTVLRIAALVSLAASVALLPGPASGQSIAIGVAAPLTGNLARLGQELVEGAQLAADLVNARGGIKGRPIVIRIEDDQADPKVALVVARKFAADDAVLAVLGHYSPATSLAAIPVYTRARLATITPSASSPDLTKRGGKYLFRMLPPSSVYARNLAQYTARTLGKKSVAVVYVQDDWGIRAKDRFAKELEQLGAKVTAAQAVQDGATDFTAALKKIKGAAPDALAVLTYYTTGALVTTQARNLEIKVPVVGTAALHDDRFIEVAGLAHAEGVTVNAEFSADDPAPVVESFVLAFEKLHPREKPRAYHALAYDAVRIALDAIESAGLDRDAIRDAIAGTRSFAGVTGTFAFNDQREREATDQAYLTVRDGEWTFIGRH
jgi:branched-chain amino acid transport system substrate-binding protein